MAPSASDNKSESLVGIIVLRCSRGDWVVILVEREERYADRVALVVARCVRVVSYASTVREGEQVTKVKWCGELERCQARLCQNGRKRLGRRACASDAGGSSRSDE